MSEPTASSEPGRPLQRIEEELRILGDALPLFVSYVDRNERYLFTNKACEDWFQLTREDILGEHVKDVLDAKFYQSIKPYITTALGGETICYEKLFTDKNGRSRYIHASYVPHVAEDNEVIGLFALIEDITQHKTAEQALRESKERLRSVFDAVPDAIITIDESGMIGSFSPAAERVFGYTAGEVIGQNVRMLMPSPYREQHDRYLARFRETGEQKIIGTGREVTARRKDGTTFPINLAVNEMVFDGGRMFTGIVHDVSRLKRAESLNSRLGRIIDQSVNEIFMFDAETFKFTLVNRGACQNTGYEEAELKTLNCPDIVPSWGRSDLEELVRPLREGRTDQVVFECVHRRKDGSTYDVEARIQLLPKENPPVFVAVIQDITERKQTEQELRQAQKMDAIGQLTGGMAHDFNNLLTVILGNLEMLESLLDDNARAHTFLEEAANAARLGAQLNRHLLAFSRQQALDPKVVNLNSLVTGMMDLFRRALGETITVSTVLAPDLKKTLADPAQVQNALLNLAINGRDAMPDGGSLIISTENASFDSGHVDGRIRDLDKEYVRLSVRDSGTGIPEEIEAHIIEPFFTTKETGKGSGLGLSMVYGFAKQSGGHLQFRTDPGKGTDMSLYLPCTTNREEAVRQNDRSCNLPAARGETVLLVEDHHLVRNITVKRLEHLGYTVFAAENGQCALDVLQNLPRVDLLFTDIVMPGGMSGTDLAIKARYIRPSIKVIYSSGYSSRDTAPLEDGAWLPKPHSLAEMAGKIREILDGS